VRQPLNERSWPIGGIGVLHLHGLRERLRRHARREGRFGAGASLFEFLPTRASLDLQGWPSRTFSRIRKPRLFEAHAGRLRPVSVTLEPRSGLHYAPMPARMADHALITPALWSSGEFGSKPSRSGRKTPASPWQRATAGWFGCSHRCPAAVILAIRHRLCVSLQSIPDAVAEAAARHGNLVVSGTKITMESPHLSGYSTDQRPYDCG